MTPKEKAEELVKLYAKLIWDEKEFKMELYKQCVLIAVDEILESAMIYLHLHQIDYWEEVKKEIKLL